MDLRRKKEIVGWIKNHAPTSCFAINNKDVEVDDLFPDIDEIVDYFYFDELDMCGCGYPRQGKKLILKILETFDSRGFFNFNNENDEEKIGLYDIVLKMLDKCGFTDHNHSVFSCNLTNNGKMLLDVLKEVRKYL